MPDRVTVYVGIGSNVDREHNLNRGLALLRQRFGQLVVSPIYECPAVGFEGSHFYNAALSFETGESAADVNAALREIEDASGRDRSLPKFSPRTLDLDLLLYGDQVIDRDGLQIPRTDILEYDFVLKPLADLAPELVHPLAGKPMCQLWEAFDKTGSRLRLACMPAMAPGI